jgi:uncharacterized protein YggU (UPF0235/DUF167 family)
VTGVYGERLRVEVTAPPEKGKANEAVRVLLARLLGVPRDAVEIAAGAGSRDKAVLVEGLAPADARERLAAL